MGFFSWHTNDTNEPIWNCHTGKHDTVYMIDNLGNQWVEHFYDGYGEFGGKDYYELLAEMNGLPSDRGEGIDLAFSNPRKKHITPNLVTKPNQKWQPVEPKNHMGQGYWED
tara:strand:+ start:231 stop:563 length:333 start_codon:yes stop_codon:yes gene_type:complete